VKSGEVALIAFQAGDGDTDLLEGLRVLENDPMAPRRTGVGRILSEASALKSV